MPTQISGKEVAKIRANLEKKGQLDVARSLFAKNIRQQMEQRQRQQAQPQPQQGKFQQLIEGFKEGFGEATSEVFSRYTSEPYVRSQMNNRNTYITYRMSQLRREENPQRRKQILESINNARKSRSPEEIALTDSTDAQNLMLGLGFGSEIASSLPIGMSVRGGAIGTQMLKQGLFRKAVSSTLPRAVGTGSLVAAESALTGAGKGESLESIKKRGASGFAVGTGASLLLGALGRLVLRGSKAKKLGGEAIEMARDAAIDRTKAVQKEQKFLRSLRTGKVNNRNVTRKQFKEAYSTQRNIEKVRRELSGELNKAKQVARKARETGDIPRAKIAEQQAGELTEEMSKLTEDVSRLRGITGVRSKNFLRQPPKARKIEFKKTQQGGGEKIPVTVKKTGPVARVKGFIEKMQNEPPSVKFEENSALRRVLGREADEAEMRVYVGLDEATPGSRVFKDGEVLLDPVTGKPVKDTSSFPNWLPEHLRSSNLVRQFSKLVQDNKLPTKRQVKLRELFAETENQINEQLGIKIRFTPDDFIQKPASKPRFDPVVEFGEEVVETKTVGKRSGKDIEFTGGVVKTNKPPTKAQGLADELRSRGVKGEHTAGTVKVKQIDDQATFKSDLDQIDESVVAAKQKQIENGMTPEPIVLESVDKKLRLVDGHHTLTAAKRAGKEDVPVVFTKKKPKPAPEPSKPSNKSSIKKLKETLQESKKLTRRQKQVFSKERSKRFKKSESVGREAQGEKALSARKSQLGGELPKIDIEPLRGKIKKADVDNLFDEINNHTVLLPGEKVHAMEGLRRLLDGSLPQDSQRQLLEEVFGTEVVDLMTDQRGPLGQIYSYAVNAANIPRTIMASVDLSASLRQGAIMAAYKPKLWSKAFVSQFKYFVSEKAYQRLNNSIREMPTYSLMRENKLSLTELGSDITSREEAFKSSLAEKIPVFGRLIRASGRAYTGFLNKLRADTFNELANVATKEGILSQNPDELASIANFINNATGRGGIKAFEGSAGDLMNAALFSPRLQWSRINMLGLNPKFYMDMEPFARKQAIKAMFRFVGAGSTVLTLSKMAGAEVGLDPRSADFGKMKVGNTRYDIWAGYQQYPRLIAQLATGTLISSTTGKKYTMGEGFKPITRTGILGRAIEMKFAPIPSFTMSLIRGQTSIGEEFEWDVETANRMIPLVVQDMYDLYKERGMEGVPMAFPAVFGVGLQTYGTREFKLDRDEEDGPNLKRENVSGMGEDLVNWIKRTPPNEADKYLDTYERVRELNNSGQRAAAARITGGMSKEDYEIYKMFKKEFEKEKQVEVKDEIEVKLEQVEKLMSQGDEAAARQITADMTPIEYKTYKAMKKERDIEF